MSVLVAVATGVISIYPCYECRTQNELRSWINATSQAASICSELILMNRTHPSIHPFAVCLAMRLSRKMTTEMTEQESSRQTPAGTMGSTLRQPRGKRLINRQLVCLGSRNACVCLRFGIINSIQPAAKVANINYNNNDNQGCARFASTKHIPPCGTWVLFNPRSLLPFEKFIARQRNHWTK